MAAVLRCTTLAIRTDPLEAPTPQTVAPWAEVLAFLQHVATLAEAGTAFQLVETPGQVAWRRRPRSCRTGEGRGRAPPPSFACKDLSAVCPDGLVERRPLTRRQRGEDEG